MKKLHLSPQGFAQVSLLPGGLPITCHILGQQCHLMDKQQFVLLGDLFMCRLHAFTRGEEETDSYCCGVVDFPSSNTTLEKLLLFPLWKRAHRTCEQLQEEVLSQKRLLVHGKPTKLLQELTQNKDTDNFKGQGREHLQC